MTELRHIIYSIILLMSSVTYAAETHVVCQGDSKQYWVDSVAGSGSTYSWRLNGTIVQTSYALYKKTWDVVGIFQLSVVETNSFGCEGEERVIDVHVTGLPQLQATGQSPAYCNSPGTINFSFLNVPDGMYDIQYATGEFKDVAVSGGTALIAAPPGDYLNLIVSNGGCASTEIVNVTIQALQPPEIIDYTAKPSVNAQPDGELHIIAQAYNPPLQYNIDGINWQNEPDFLGLSPGLYTVIIRDDKLCEDQMICEVPLLEFAEVEILSDEGIQCLGPPVREPVFTKNFSSIASFEIRFTYDVSVVEFTEIGFKHSGLDAGTMNVISFPGEVIISWSIAGSVSVPDGLLFDMLFFSKAPGTSGINWDPVEYMMLHESGYQVPAMFSSNEITIKPVPLIEATGGGNFCEGDQTILKVNSFDQQVLDLLWSGPESFTATSAEIVLSELTLRQTGTYNVTAVNAAGCSAEQSFELFVNQGVNLFISETEELCAGISHRLDAGIDYDSYLWNTGSTMSYIEVADAGTYTVEVINSAGCKGSASVDLVPCNLSVLFPNAFAPNGLNYLFRPVIDSDNVPVAYILQVFNKWGQRVFETEDYEHGWDGNINGKPAPAGVYVFKAYFIMPGYLNSTIANPQTGHFMLIR